MFKNVRFLRLSGAWPSSEDALHEALAAAAFKPCGPLTEQTSGWEAPTDTEEARLCRSVAGTDLIQLRTQSRLLPAAAVNEALEARLEEYRERTGELPGRREKRRMKLETRDNLLPKALLRSERTRGIYLRSERMLAIDAAAPARIERFVAALDAALGKTEVSTLEFKRPVANLLTKTLLGDAPPGVSLGRECRMQDPSDSKATVRWSDMDLYDADVRKLVRDGMKLTHLGLTFDNVMSCVLDEHGGLGKLKLLGADGADAGGDTEPLAQFDAELVLLTGTLRAFLSTLGKALGTTE